MTGQPKPPPATELTRAQYSGWACCWCGTSLKHGGVSAGRSRGRLGAHVLDVEVYACRWCCPKKPQPLPSQRAHEALPKRLPARPVNPAKNSGQDGAIPNRDKRRRSL
jgi:hypothetical protein